jgi:transcriptional regulator GlxA family with amidase domain
MQSTTADNYSIETMVRYALSYEIQNKLQPKTNQNQNDPELQAVIRYMQARIDEIAKKYK